MLDRRNGCLMPFAFAGVMLAAMVAGCIVSPDGGKPSPGPDAHDGGSKVDRQSAVTVAARDSLAEYGRQMADNFDAVADRLDDESISEAAEANSELAELNKASRHDAFSRVDREFQSRFGGDKWDAVKAAKAFREAAKGLRK